MITKTQLDCLKEQNLLSQADYQTLLSRLDPREFKPWVACGLLVLGVVFLSCAVVFFVAANWAQMGRWLRLALPLMGLLSCALGVYFKGLETTIGQAFSFGAAVSIGVFLAVFGQQYQMGAFVYELFFCWALLLTPLALLARNKWLWLMTFYVLMIFVYSYFQSAWRTLLDVNRAAGFVTICFCALAGWGLAEFSGVQQKTTRHFGSFFWMPLFVFVLSFGCLGILGSSPFSRLYIWTAAVLFAGAGAYALFYVRDTLLLGGSALGLVSLLACWWGKTYWQHAVWVSLFFALVYTLAGYGVYMGERFMSKEPSWKNKNF